LKLITHRRHTVEGYTDAQPFDHASGAKTSRPELDKALAPTIRAGDQLVITRMDRLGRSVLHLVILGAALSERDVGLRVLE
ncbi:MAG TPA: hypothetical protein DHV61_03975, partial [Glutamicibacter sp.]|nr:hypothetical protein [Glutamicibacter sp.]